MSPRPVVLTAAALLGAGLLAGCAGRGAAAPPLTVLAGSELRDLEPLLPEIEKKTGLRLQFDYTGTLDGAERLAAGSATDLAWFSHAKYLALQSGVRGRVLAQERIMLSPVVMGVKESLARRWGWTPDGVSWKDIAAKVGTGELSFGMTNPASSNSGFTALVGVVAALSGKGDAITRADVSTPTLKAFFRGQKLTAGSSGFLSDAYLREQDRLGGLVNYESVLLSLNAGGRLREKLTLLYPKDGLITADYPLMLVNDARRADYEKLVAYLRGPDFQRLMMEKTLRRPVNADVPLAATFPKALLVELPFPGSKDVVDAILFAYLDENRAPAHTFFVLDTSGSMQGDRLSALKTALKNLAGADTSLTGQFARFAARERVSIVDFDSDARPPQTFELPDRASAGPVLARITGVANGLRADGGTAIYSALRAAYEDARLTTAADAGRFRSIVLMTDGENNQGLSRDDFLAYLRSLPPELRSIRVFPILFGEADASDLQVLADTTGGRLFDGRKNDLAAVFKEIRGYQ